MALYFITGNPHKFREAKMLIPEIELLDIDLPELQSLDGKEIIEAKLKEAMRHHDGEFIVEDLGMHFHCIDGLPGPLIKWFITTLKAEGLSDLVHRYEDHGAHIRYLLGYAREADARRPGNSVPEDAKAGRIEFFEIIVEGEIVRPRGRNGFGFDPIFVPEGSDKTYAEMTPDEKNAVSHRGKALRMLKERLAQTQGSS